LRDGEIDGPVRIVGDHLDARDGESLPPVVEIAEHDRAAYRSGEDEPWVDAVEAQRVSSL
jgi:hypothetical protein